MDRAELPLIPALLLALAGLLASAPAAAGVYQWKDAQGRVHFGDRAPEAVDGDGNGEVVEHATAAAKERAPDVAFSIIEHGRRLPPGIRERAEQAVHRMVQVYRTTFGLEIRRTVVVKAHIFDDQQELVAWATEITGRQPGNVIGLFLLQQKQVGVINLEDDPEETLKTLIHESNHVILDQVSPRAPLWLNEGLSQYFEGIDTSTERFVVQPDLRNADLVHQLIERKKLIHLHDYLVIPPGRWQQMAHHEGNPVPYVIGWSLTGFLMSQPLKRRLLGSMLQDLEKANIPPDLDTFVRRYPGGLTVLEYEWFKWAMQPASPQVLD